METPRIVMEGKSVSVGYGKKGKGRAVLSGLDFRLRGGELVSLLGANGTGKSTLLRTLAALQSPLSGSIELMGRPLASYTERERSRLIGIVLTDHAQTGGLTVRELVALGRQPYTGFFGRLGKTDREKTNHALRAVGVWDKRDRYVAELSDGERQKVMIAKALVQECPLILLDEPTAFLDVANRIEIMGLLHRLATEEGRAVLLSTHDVEEALTLSDELWLLSGDDGLLCGCTEDLVLTHRMDGLFPHSGIGFDLSHGRFSSVRQTDKTLVLTAADNTLERWARNALLRNGWQCCTSSVEVGKMPLLEVLSPFRMQFTADGRTESFASFGELLGFLHTVL